jgi:SAM-dependent methyltransferase
MLFVVVRDQMATSTTRVNETLPQEMQQHTYAILRRVEGTHWWFVGRRKIIEGFLAQICSSISGEPRILDVGCGTGANLEMLSRFGDAEGIDVSHDALNFCRERGLQNVKWGEAARLPFESETFDLVTAFDVVEHLDDDVGGLKSRAATRWACAAVCAGLHVSVGRAGRREPSSTSLHTCRFEAIGRSRRIQS